MALLTVHPRRQGLHLHLVPPAGSTNALYLAALFRRLRFGTADAPSIFCGLLGIEPPYLFATETLHLFSLWRVFQLVFQRQAIVKRVDTIPAWSSSLRRALIAKTDFYKFLCVQFFAHHL